MRAPVEAKNFPKRLYYEEVKKQQTSRNLNYFLPLWTYFLVKDRQDDFFLFCFFGYFQNLFLKKEATWRERLL